MWVMMQSRCNDNYEGNPPIPMTLLEGGFDSTKRQGIAFLERDDSKKWLYFAGNGPAKKIIGMGKLGNSSMIESVGNVEHFLALVQEKRPEFYIIEGARNMGYELLRNFLEVIDRARHSRSSAASVASSISVAIVENKSGKGLLERLKQEYHGIHFYHARSIGSDTIDVGLC